MPLTLFSGQGPSRPVAVCTAGWGPGGQLLGRTPLQSRLWMLPLILSALCLGLWCGHASVLVAVTTWILGSRLPVWAFVLYLKKVGDGERQCL